MPSVIHGGDDLIDLLEVPNTNENGGTKAPYDISQYRTIVEEEEGRMGVWELASSKVFQSYVLWNIRKRSFRTWYESCYHN